MLEDKTHKFVKKDEVCSLFTTLIQEESKKRSWEYPLSIFDPSHLTECPRRIIYRANGNPPEKPISYLVFHSEIFTKKKWIEFLSKFQSVHISGKNIVAADCHYNISGNVDAVLNIRDVNYVTKIQPVCNSNFSQIKKEGASKRHVVELIVYIWLTELNDGLLLYENQDSNEYMIFHIKFYEPVIKSVTKKCLELIENKIQGVIPSRPYKTRDSVECSECEFTNRCWQEKK